MQRENIDEARARITKNLEISRREHTEKIEGRFLRLLGEVQMKRNESDKAIHSLREATVILKEVGNPRQLWQAYASLASAYDKSGRPSEARQQWGAATEVIQKTANALSDRELQGGFLNAKPIRGPRQSCSPTHGGGPRPYQIRELRARILRRKVTKNGS